MASRKTPSLLALIMLPFIIFGTMTVVGDGGVVATAQALVLASRADAGDHVQHADGTQHRKEGIQ